MRWRPGDRFRVGRDVFMLVDALDPQPWKAFVTDYADVRLWSTVRSDDEVRRFVVTGEFLRGALPVERLPSG